MITFFSFLLLGVYVLLYSNRRYISGIVPETSKIMQNKFKKNIKIIKIQKYLAFFIKKTKKKLVRKIAKSSKVCKKSDHYYTWKTCLLPYLAW